MDVLNLKYRIKTILGGDSEGLIGQCIPLLNKTKYHSLEEQGIQNINFLT